MSGLQQNTMKYVSSGLYAIITRHSDICFK